MTRKGWLWFAGVQVVGIGCALIVTPSFFKGGFLLLPGSLLPWMETEIMKNPGLSSGAGEVLVLIAAIVVNALSWRSAAKILREQGLT
jgi:hypothetical protein